MNFQVTEKTDLGKCLDLRNKCSGLAGFRRFTYPHPAKYHKVNPIVLPMLIFITTILVSIFFTSPASHLCAAYLVKRLYYSYDP